MFLEVGNTSIPKNVINTTKNGTDKSFTTQWLSTSPNSISYVKTLLFSIFITLHLGKGHIQAVNRHFGPDVVCYSAFI